MRWKLCWQLAVAGLAGAALLAQALAQATAPADSALAPLVLWQGMTKAALERVAFSDTTLTPEAHPKPNTPLIFPDITVGLHLNSATYAAGAPITAYFVVKNLQGVTRGIDLRPEHFRDLSRTAKSVKFDLRRSDGRDFSAKTPSTAARIAEELEFAIPPRGLICFSGDLRTLGAANVLPPGEYVFTWSYGGLKSREAGFTITAGQAATAPATQPAAQGQTQGAEPADVGVMPERVEFLDLMGTSTKRRRGDAILDWTNSMPNRSSGTQNGCALAAGVDGRFYPDMLNLPTRDESFELSAVMVPGVRQVGPAADESDARKDQSQDHIVVKITPVGAADAVLPRMMLGNNATVIGLQVESTGPITRVNQNMEGEGTQDIGAESWNLDKGGTLNITLRADWKKALPFYGKARVAVVLMSERSWLAFQPDGQESEAPSPKSARYWRGVLRTNYFQVDLPKR